jgi:hypothetical protein
MRRKTPLAEAEALLRQHLGQELRVNVLRLESETARIFVTERAPAGYQLPLL